MKALIYRLLLPLVLGMITGVAFLILRSALTHKPQPTPEPRPSISFTNSSGAEMVIYLPFRSNMFPLWLGPHESTVIRFQEGLHGTEILVEKEH